MTEPHRVERTDKYHIFIRTIRARPYQGSGEVIFPALFAHERTKFGEWRRQIGSERTVNHGFQFG